jgi:hypothetical protein
METNKIKQTNNQTNKTNKTWVASQEALFFIYESCSWTQGHGLPYMSEFLIENIFGIKLRFQFPIGSLCLV